MGVAGSGKSTIGAGLSKVLCVAYVDGDDLHPPENIAKMSAGHPLDDNDRAPWLDRVGGRIAIEPGPLLIGCSALKRVYRDRIRAAAARPITFLHLTGSRNVIAERMATRPGHFMPPSLLDSQFDTLEPPAEDECSVAVDIDQPVDDIVKEAARLLETTA
ncbi:MAG: gluconokinase [Pseudomonadota bacterium]